MRTTSPESAASSGADVQQQIAVGTMKQIAADPRTTNALLLVMVLCISGYMPDSFTTLCGY